MTKAPEPGPPESGELATLLAALPADPDDIAAYLTRLDIRGFQGWSNACPIANYLVARGSYESALASLSVVWVYRGGQDLGERAETPNAVRAFIQRFDGGQFPALELSHDYVL